MTWTSEAIDRFDGSFYGDRNAYEVFSAGRVAEQVAARDFRDYVKPEDVDRAIRSCWK